MFHLTPLGQKRLLEAGIGPGRKFPLAMLADLARQGHASEFLRPSAFSDEECSVTEALLAKFLAAKSIHLTAPCRARHPPRPPSRQGRASFGPYPALR
jgi:hypothetical protein